MGVQTNKWPSPPKVAVLTVECDESHQLFVKAKLSLVPRLINLRVEVVFDLERLLTNLLAPLYDDWSVLVITVLDGFQNVRNEVFLDEKVDHHQHEAVTTQPIL